jgi:hypothetical protein
MTQRRVRRFIVDLEDPCQSQTRWKGRKPLPARSRNGLFEWVATGLTV